MVSRLDMAQERLHGNGGRAIRIACWLRRNTPPIAKLAQTREPPMRGQGARPHPRPSPAAFLPDGSFHGRTLRPGSFRPPKGAWRRLHDDWNAFSLQQPHTADRGKITRGIKLQPHHFCVSLVSPGLAPHRALCLCDAQRSDKWRAEHTLILSVSYNKLFARVNTLRSNTRKGYFTPHMSSHAAPA